MRIHSREQWHPHFDEYDVVIQNCNTSTFGHVWNGDVQPVTVRDIGVQTLLMRGLQWLARRSVDAELPTDFPTADATSIGPPLD